MTERYDPDAARDELEPWIVRDEGEETRAYCPLCEEPGASHSPSASINFEDNVWNCLKTDDHGGSVARLVRDLRRGNTTPRTPKQRQPTPDLGVTEADVERWHDALMSDPQLVEQIEELRGWSAATLVDFQIGIDGRRFTIPIYGADGELVNVRKYLPGAEGSQKMRNIQGTQNAIFGYEVFEEADAILWCAGEPDRILACQEGFDAVTHTGGEHFFNKDWVPLFVGKTVYVCYDADDAGRSGANKVMTAIRTTAEAVYEVVMPEVRQGYDITDLIMDEGPEALAELIENAHLVARRTQPAEQRHIDPGVFFDHGALQVSQLAHTIMNAHPCALAQNLAVAVYQHGVFRRDELALRSALTQHLQNRYRTGHEHNVEAFIQGELARMGWLLPDRVLEPLLNVRNGMLDLPTTVLKDHDPKYLSSAQLPVEWDPHATCPTYDEWILNQAGDQVALLEETIAAMLDPSSTPTKALFLYGDPRSGKSTVLRLLEAMVGPENRSAVSLHQLATDRFASANIAGAMLNTSGDLSAQHVEDVSLFKKMTGEDAIHADKKFGRQFTFTNRALFAFSANQIPSVGENSRAYIDRIVPVRFNNSFAGAENPDWERRMLRELPGILVRWVRAWQNRMERGHALPVSEEIMHEFEINTDRVQHFIAECCEILDVQGNSLWERGSTIKELFDNFVVWIADEKAMSLGKRSFAARIRNARGVMEGRFGEAHSRGFNIVIKPREEWGKHD